MLPAATALVPRPLPDLLPPRLATPDDIPQLVSLINEAYTDAHYFKAPKFYDRVNTESMQTYLKKDFIIVVENTAGLICGTVRLYPSTSSYVETQTKHCGMSLLAVHPTVTRRGMGKYLFQVVQEYALWLDDQAPGQGWDLLQVEVVNLQEHLVRIYRAWGFAETGRLEWADTGVPADCLVLESHLVVMQRHLRTNRSTDA
ncbi:hypothetical protein HDU82_005102 [Entophlyctis luteolus]|nr:hypothetical protein HDU82_005102 [Entophlyctis luteolus]